MSDAPLRQLLLRVTSRAEEEIRAHPRAYEAFYRVIASSPRLRSVAGRAKSRLRGARAPVAPPAPLDSPLALARRRQAVAARLGLPAEDRR